MYKSEDTTCYTCGCLSDIIRHERLQHGRVYEYRDSIYATIPDMLKVATLEEEYTRPSNSIIIGNYQKEKFISLFKGWVIRKRRGTFDEYKSCYNTDYWDIRFHNGCTIAIDVRSYGEGGNNIYMEVFFQEHDNFVPWSLITYSLGDDNDDETIKKYGITNQKAIISLIDCFEVKGLDDDNE